MHQLVNTLYTAKKDITVVLKRIKNNPALVAEGKDFQKELKPETNRWYSATLKPMTRQKILKIIYSRVSFYDELDKQWQALKYWKHIAYYQISCL